MYKKLMTLLIGLLVGLISVDKVLAQSQITSEFKSAGNYCTEINYSTTKVTTTCFNNSAGTESKGVVKTLTAVCVPKSTTKGLFSRLAVTDKKVIQPGWSVELKAVCPTSYMVETAAVR